MAVEVKISMFGDVYFRRRIQAMRYRSRDMSPVLEDIKGDWVDIIEEQFETEGKRTGRPWKQLKLDTVFKRGSSHPILIDSADMLLHVTDPGNVHVSDDEIWMSFEGAPDGVAARAEAHQHGYHNVLTGTDVPARPIVDFTDIDERRMRSKITKFLVHGE